MSVMCIVYVCLQRETLSCIQDRHSWWGRFNDCTGAGYL